MADASRPHLVKPIGKESCTQPLRPVLEGQVIARGNVEPASTCSFIFENGGLSGARRARQFMGRLVPSFLSSSGWTFRWATSIVLADFATCPSKDARHGLSNHSEAGLDRNSERGMPPSPTTTAAWTSKRSANFLSPLALALRAPFFTSKATRLRPRVRMKSTSRPFSRQ